MEDSSTPVNSKLRLAFEQVHNSGGTGGARLLDDNIQAWNERWKMLESRTGSGYPGLVGGSFAEQIQKLFSGEFYCLIGAFQ